MITITTRSKPWRIATNGTVSIQFIVIDAGREYPNDRYTVIFDNPLNNGGKRGTTYPYISLNALGMGYHGEVDQSYVEAAIRGDLQGEHLIGWDDLNQDCHAAAIADIRSYLEQELSMAS